MDHVLSTKDFDIQSYPLINPNVDPRDPQSRVTLVEIPGLNDANNAHAGDVEIVKQISSWLER